MRPLVRACGLAVLSAIVLLEMSCVAAAQDAPGRYQIVAAQIEGQNGVRPIVIKIDTQTGECWMLSLIGTPTNPVGFIYGWTALEKDAPGKYFELFGKPGRPKP